MKYIIVGKHASGKKACLDQIENDYPDDIVVGREFSNIPALVPQLYMDSKYVKYDIDDIDKIFENNSYLCIGGIEERGILDSYMYYRGIAMYTLDRSDVISLSPSQVVNINKKILREPVCFVWMDDTIENRRHRYIAEHRLYSFDEIEQNEKVFEQDFVKALYSLSDARVMYFMNEEPERVATIIGTCIKHPDVADKFIKYFN